MAQRPQDLLSRLADRGEEVIGKLGDMPGAQRLLEQASVLKERADELQKRIRGLDELERRVAALERKVDQLSKSSAGGTAKTRATGAKKAPTTTKRTTGAKPKSPE
jgi:hypothetical protein